MTIPPDLKFETALSELEALVEQMENGKLELEASLTAYQHGISLLQHCQAQLAIAEQKIQVMENTLAKDRPQESNA